MTASPPIVIAFSQRVTQASGYVEPRDALAQDWSRWLSTIDRQVLPILLPNHPELACAMVRHFSPALLVLTGGNDLGDAPVRDATEEAVLKLFHKKPVLGVCRGMQLLAAQSGWKTVEGPGGHAATRHPLQWDSTTRTRFAAETPAEVNSYHNQLLLQSDQADDWDTLACHPDGSVEMIVHRDEPWIGIMWHPEREESPAPFDQSILKTLLESGQ